MTNNIVTVIISSKYLQINEIHDIRERFIILEVYIIFVGIQLKESGITPTIGIRNPSSTAKIPQLRTWNPQLGIQKPRLS